MKKVKNDFIFRNVTPYRNGTLLHLLTAQQHLPVEIPTECSPMFAPTEADLNRLEVFGECYDLEILDDQCVRNRDVTFQPVESGITTSCGYAVPTGKIRFTGRILEQGEGEMYIDYIPNTADIWMGEPLHTHISDWLVETGDLKIHLTVDHDDALHVGSIIRGTAELKGFLEPQTKAEKARAEQKPIMIRIQYGKEKIPINLSDFPEELLTDEGIQKVRGYTIRNDADISCYQKALKRKDAMVINNLGWMYWKDIGQWSNHQEGAIDMFVESARMGCTTAMVNMGNLFEERKEYVHAKYWYDAASAAGDRKGTFNYANMLHQGWGAEPDYREAYRLFRALYDDGYKDGTCFYLGLYAEYGYCGPVDYAAAKEFYFEGDLRGDAYCCTNLGRMYSEDGPLETDLKLAFRYYSRGAELGDAVAMANLGWMYENGLYVEKDLNQAVDQYLMALENGFAPAGEAVDRVVDMIEAEEKVDSLNYLHYEKAFREKSGDEVHDKEFVLELFNRRIEMLGNPETFTTLQDAIDSALQYSETFWVSIWKKYGKDEFIIVSSNARQAACDLGYVDVTDEWYLSEVKEGKRDREDYVHGRRVIEPNEDRPNLPLRSFIYYGLV